MDRAVLSEKLESLRRCVARIETKRVASAGALARDVDAQDIVALNLTRAVQLCVDIAAYVLVDSGRPAPATMGDAFGELAVCGWIDDALAERMRAAVGFRNLAVHAYRPIDWDIVHRLTYEGLDDLRSFAARMVDAAGMPS